VWSVTLPKCVNYTISGYISILVSLNTCLEYLLKYPNSLIFSMLTINVLSSVPISVIIAFLTCFKV